MTAMWRSRDELVHQLVTLAQQGLSRRALSRTLGISRNTVRVLLAVHGEQRETESLAVKDRLTRPPRVSKVDAFDARVAELLAGYPDITAQQVFETLRDEGFDEGYTAVKKRIRHPQVQLLHPQVQLPHPPVQLLERVVPLHRLLRRGRPRAPARCLPRAPQHVRRADIAFGCPSMPRTDNRTGRSSASTIVARTSPDAGRRV